VVVSTLNAHGAASAGPAPVIKANAAPIPRPRPASELLFVNLTPEPVFELPRRVRGNKRANVHFQRLMTNPNLPV
jgi:hypothetical protein